MQDEFKKQFEVGTRAQVTARNHVNEGMVGDVVVIEKSGILKLESNSGTRFSVSPEDVRIVAPFPSPTR